jgi:hypothetical protein
MEKLSPTHIDSILLSTTVSHNSPTRTEKSSGHALITAKPELLNELRLWMAAILDLLGGLGSQRQQAMAKVGFLWPKASLLTLSSCATSL